MAEDSRKTVLALRRTANEELLNRAILHGHRIQALATAEAEIVIGFLDRKVIPDLIEKLYSRLARTATRGFDPGPWTTQWYKDMIVSLDTVVRSGVSAVSQDFRDRLGAVAISEAEWQGAVISGAGPISLAVDMPAVATLKTLVFQRPIIGQFYTEWWEALGASVRGEVHDALRIGILQGETNDQIVRRVAGTRARAFTDGVVGKWRRWASGVVRTQVRHASMRARQAVYRENLDLIKAERFVATLDSRTTEICMSLDGRLFGVMEGPTPPMHHQCRSDRVPVLRSWRELGFNLKEAPPGTRASYTGQVPATLTYNEWLKSQPWQVQKEALGSTRARAFRMGTSVDRFVDSKFRRLTLDELRNLEGLPQGVPETLTVLPGWRPGDPTNPADFFRG